MSAPSNAPSLALQAKAEYLRRFMDFVRIGAMKADFPAARLYELDLVVEEIFLNVCHHAYPDGAPGIVVVTYWVLAPGELKVEIADQGTEFNPLAADSPDVTLDIEHRPIGGLGILLTKRLAPSLTYQRRDGWNRLTFRMSTSKSQCE